MGSMVTLLWIALVISVLIFLACLVLVYFSEVTYIRILSGLGIVITIGAAIFIIYILQLEYAFGSG
jgi:hypothetical protein